MFLENFKQVLKTVSFSPSLSIAVLPDMSPFSTPHMHFNIPKNLRIKPGLATARRFQLILCCFLLNLDNRHDCLGHSLKDFALEMPADSRGLLGSHQNTWTVLIYEALEAVLVVLD